jgi:DnaJ like chaperone protein
MKFEEKVSNNYYEILNSKPTDDWDTIKKNYRELVKQYHYDKLASKNLPKDMLEYAENRLKEINEAYEALKKLKGK